MSDGSSHYFNDAYALDLYQCDQSGWWWHLVRQDIGIDTLHAREGDSDTLDPKTIQTQLRFDHASTQLHVCFAIKSQDPFEGPSKGAFDCTFTYPLAGAEHQESLLKQAG
ncbi:hypothetical protein [Ktedonobacter robiniae]|uniref:Uncharacterized protein n=1 Tax=Ktedonobacter robiniae TaxID=2778365 RepID=A0ABQ3USW9_9CHLR|nr:hypothetical protein [Ktedonobacter robiniae]GHO55824.1 hypothetical protein KSB_42990 [Ktedonobacter robiniae]